MSTDVDSDDEMADPVSYFLQDITYHGKTERTQEAYERVLRSFEAFLESARGTRPESAERRDCMAWVHTLRGEHSRSTVATYASYINRFYAYMVQVGAFGSNPMTLVVEEMDESIDTDPSRRDISISEMRAFVSDISHPLDRAVVVTLLKTGVRVGELCNLDIRDLHIADEDVESAYGERFRGPLDGRPDSIYVSEKPTRGEVCNGEERRDSNKRKRATIVPVDEETKRVLKRWLAIRPDSRSPADPLFCSTREWGRRLTIGMVGNRVTSYAEARGWHRDGGGAEENVTPHYFRHFFTTHLRDRTGDRGIVKYLRGDVATDIIDTYTHNWGGRVRDVYEANIYSLL